MKQPLNELPRFVLGEQVVVNGVLMEIESIEAERLTLKPCSPGIDMEEMTRKIESVLSRRSRARIEKNTV